MSEQKTRWWKFRKMSRKDYGGIAGGALLVAILRDSYPLPPLLSLLCDVIIIFGLFAFIQILIDYSKNKKHARQNQNN